MYLFDVPGVIVRCLKDERLVLQGGLQGDVLHRFHTDVPLAELLVTVFVRAAGIFAVVEMYGIQAVEPDDLIKLRQHAVEVVHDIIPRVPDVTGVEAYAELIVQLHAVDDFPELLKAPTHLRTLARHRFEQDDGLHFGEENAVERLGDQFDPLFRTLTGMCSGVEVVEVSWEVLHPLNILFQHIQAVRTGGGICGAEIHGVAPVCDHLAEVMLFEQRIQRRRVLGDDILAFSAARIAGEVGEGVAAEFQHGFAHRLISVRHAQVTADVYHSILRYVFLYCDTNRRICPEVPTLIEIAFLLSYRESNYYCYYSDRFLLEIIRIDIYREENSKPKCK